MFKYHFPDLCSKIQIHTEETRGRTALIPGVRKRECVPLPALISTVNLGGLSESLPAARFLSVWLLVTATIPRRATASMPRLPATRMPLGLHCVRPPEEARRGATAGSPLLASESTPRSQAAPAPRPRVAMRRPNRVSRVKRPGEK